MEKPAEQIIQVGCNYHTTWQSDRRMRFVLKEIKGDRARLSTRRTGKTFWTDVSDLIFIDTKYNKNKAVDLAKKESELTN